jgi:hypothetical protein
MLGRFLQIDPLGYVDGMSLYAYVKANPVKWTDPSGMVLLAVAIPFLGKIGISSTAIGKATAVATTVTRVTAESVRLGKVIHRYCRRYPKKCAMHVLDEGLDKYCKLNKEACPDDQDVQEFAWESFCALFPDACEQPQDQPDPGSDSPEQCTTPEDEPSQDFPPNVPRDVFDGNRTHLPEYVRDEMWEEYQEFFPPEPPISTHKPTIVDQTLDDMRRGQMGTQMEAQGPSILDDVTRVPLVPSRDRP